jgi:hypothetical protein
MLKQGWLAYDFDSKKRNSSRTYSSSFCTTYSQLVFSLNYYIGLEDDHDMGVKFTHTDKKWNYSLAFQECRRVEVW